MLKPDRLGSSLYLSTSWSGNAREISSDKIPKENKFLNLINPDQRFFFEDGMRENGQKLYISPGGNSILE